VPSAVDAGNDKVLVVSGYELGAVMIIVKKRQMAAVAQLNYLKPKSSRSD